MKALVTGASGFVGANLVEILTQAGWQVRVLLRRSSSQRSLYGLDYEPFTGNVTDHASLLRAMQGCDAVFHAAGVVADYWQQDTRYTYRVNVDGTRNVVEAALAVGVPRLVFTSSQAALGFGYGDTPVDETQYFNIHPARYPYGHSKHLAEQVVLNAIFRGLHAVIDNPSVVLGPRDSALYNSRILLQTQRGHLRWVPAGGINVVDARDVARGHLLALEKGRLGHRYLLTGHNVSLLELVQQVATVLGAPQPRGIIPQPLIAPLAAVIDGLNRISPWRLPVAGDVLRFGNRFFYADNRKAVNELGFAPVPLTETLTNTVRWLRQLGAMR